MYLCALCDFARVFSRSPHHTSHSYRGQRMACGMDGPPFHMADDARPHRRHYVVRIADTDSTVQSVLPYAQKVFAEGDRLAGSVAYLPDDAAVFLYLRLW